MSTAPMYGLVSPAAIVETISFGTPTGSARIACVAIEVPPEPPSAGRVERPSSCSRRRPRRRPRPSPIAAPRSPAARGPRRRGRPRRRPARARCPARPAPRPRCRRRRAPVDARSPQPLARYPYSTPFVSSVPTSTTVAISSAPLLRRDEGSSRGLSRSCPSPGEDRRVPTARVDRDERPAAREGDRLPVGRPRRLERVLGRERHPAKPLPVDADHEDLESSRLPVSTRTRSSSRRATRRARRPALAAGRQAPPPRAVRVHDPELPDLGARQAARVGDPPAVGRPRGLDLRCQVLRHATRAGPVGAHDVDVIAVLVALIGDPRAVRRPRGLGLVAVGRRWNAAGCSSRRRPSRRRRATRCGRSRRRSGCRPERSPDRSGSSCPPGSTCRRAPR